MTTTTIQNDDWNLCFEGVACRGISRRSFLLSGAGVAFGVVFGAPLAGVAEAFAQSGGAFAPNGWVRVAPDGTVTIYSPASEMGQGVMTAMPLLLAEEMDLDWSKVRVEQAPTNPKVFGNPRFGGGMTTGASRTTQGYYDVIRLAGLQARQVMLMAAATKLDVPVAELTTEPHQVVHQATGRRLGYGEIASFATVPAELPQVSREQLKPMSRHRLIGKDVGRVDVPLKVTGKAEYGIDVRLPGMLHGAVLRSPVQGEKPAKIDDSAALKVPGVVKVVPMPYGVGVIAQNTWAARKGKEALKVEWTSAAKARAYTSGKIVSEYDSSGVDFLKEGDAKTALAGAAKTINATFTTEHVAHACMEPMNATARVTGDRIEVWAPSQSPFFIFLATTMGLGYKPENVTSHITLLGGGFGRRVEADYVVDAGILAKAMPDTPVKVTWSREDDIRADKYRPITAQHVSAGLDAQGNLVGLRHRLVAESIYARAAPPLFQQAGGKDAPVCEGVETKYHVPNHWVEYLREQRGVDVGFWRAVGGGYTKFALETVIDECARAAGKDPLEYRLALLEKQPRGRKVLEEVAVMAGWKRKRPAGRALGLAYSDMWNVHLATIVEASVDRKTGNIRVHEVWGAVDPGVAVQPKNIEAQIESGTIYGLSHALRERITFKNGAVVQSNFHDYPVMRMNEAPLVHTKVIPTDNHPGGIGEVGLTTVAPAVANAVAQLTGKRLRSLPFDRAQLKA
jgi:isoquinoline 1-oxidoreductase beta subunit